MMDKMSFEALEKLEAPTYGSSVEQVDRMYQLTMQKAGLPAVRRTPNRTVLLMAAALAVLLLTTLLAGAGYVYSKYFSEGYRENPIYEGTVDAEHAGEEARTSLPVDPGPELLSQAFWEGLAELPDPMGPGSMNGATCDRRDRGRQLHSVL